MPRTRSFMPTCLMLASCLRTSSRHLALGSLVLASFLVFAIRSSGQEAVAVSPAELGAAARELSSSLRAGISLGNGNATGTLIAEDHWDDPKARGDSVILVPGLFAGRDSLARIRQELSEQGFATATYRYADQLAVPPVADELSSLLQKLHKEQPDRMISLVAHSLGALVSRAAIERESGPPANVKRLIMIAPPNQGSVLATLDSSEIAKIVASLGGDHVELGFLDEAIDGFVGETRVSLQPGSEMLTSMNARPRAASVRYTILAGTGGPIEREWLEVPLLIGDLLLDGLTANGRAGQHNPLASLESLIETEEWVSGRGDGVVSAQSARLDGVDDLIMLPFAHNDFGADTLIPKRRSAVERATEIILQRLRMTQR